MPSNPNRFVPCRGCGQRTPRHRGSLSHPEGKRSATSGRPARSLGFLSERPPREKGVKGL